MHAQSCLTLCDPVGCQTPLSMGFSRQEYWSGLPFLPPRDLPNLGIEPMSPALQADSLPLSHQGSPVGREHHRTDHMLVWKRGPACLAHVWVPSIHHSDELCVG